MSTLAERIAFWEKHVHIMQAEIAAGLRHPDSDTLDHARAVLRELVDIDGEPDAA